MAWTDPNAKDFTVGQVLTSDEMDTYVLANTADLDDRLVGGLKAFSTTLTDDTAAALETWEQWGTEEATAADPGRAVAVLAWGSGWFALNASTVGAVRGSMRVQISLDGGTTWTEGSRGADHGDRVNADVSSGGSLACYHLASGTPTGQVQVRAQLHQFNQSAGDITFRDGSVMGLMIPVGN